MYGLAEAQEMQNLVTRLQTRVLWMRKKRSWSSEVPSGTTALSFRPPISQIVGENKSRELVSRIDSLTWWTSWCMVLTQVFQKFCTQLLQKTRSRLGSLKRSSGRLHKQSSMLGDTWVPSLENKWKKSLVLFNLPQCISSPNRTSQGNLGSFRTYPFLTLLQMTWPQLIVGSTPQISRAHGALSEWFSYSLLGFHQVPRQQCEMSRKPIEQS